MSKGLPKAREAIARYCVSRGIAGVETDDVYTGNGVSELIQVSLQAFLNSGGYRAGWMVLCGDKSGAGGYIEGINTLVSLRLCSNVTGQSVICAALADNASTQANLMPGGRLYDQREYAYTALCAIPGISAVKPRAALYIFPKIDTSMYKITNDEKFVLDFLREKYVLLTHGGSYNWKQPDHFRLTYLPPMDVLIEVINRLREFLENYRQ